MRLLASTLVLCAACASTPKPAPQAEVPIRTQEEIARDASSTGGSIGDPSVCAGHPSAPGCTKNPKGRSPFDNTAHRNRFVHDESGNDKPLNPAMQSR